MSTSSRFAVAVHAVTLIAVRNAARPIGSRQPLTSEIIACSVGANAVTIRQVLGALREAALVRSRPGNSGGWSLAREPETIQLADIYRAVGDDTLFPLHHQALDGSCVVGRNIHEVLRPRFAAARHALEIQLAQTTIAELMQDVSCTEARQAITTVSPSR